MKDETRLEALRQAAQLIRLGQDATIPVTPVTNLPDRCTPMGVITANAYLVATVAEVEALARQLRKRNKAAGLTKEAAKKQPYILRGIRVRLMSESGSIQIGSGDVWHSPKIS